ncbi:MAG: hypothetical protein VB088_09520 [Sphaerochaeta sp.]|nr:hypothetical protein [Sphaerochaeta sp.]
MIEPKFLHILKDMIKGFGVIIMNDDWEPFPLNGISQEIRESQKTSFVVEMDGHNGKCIFIYAQKYRFLASGLP